MTILEGNRSIWHSQARRLLVAKWIVCAGFLAGMALSPRLWQSDRSFPPLPVFPLPDLPQTVCVGLSLLLVMAVVVVAVLPCPRRLIVLVLALAAILILFDITRLQPWVYFYLLFLGALALDLESAWAICGFLIATTYFWSGIQKVNVSFFHEAYPWLLRPITSDPPLWVGYTIPLVEVLIGVLLLVPRTRNAAAIGAVLMHGVLLLGLALLHDYNSVVWPWNLAMGLLAIAIFWRTPEPILARAWRSALGKALIVLTGVLPALSFADLWDDYLSDSLYSGRSRLAFIIVEQADAVELPNDALAPIDRRLARLDVGAWAIADLNVPPYPQVRVYRQLMRRAKLPPTAFLYVRDRPGLTGKLPEFTEVP